MSEGNLPLTTYEEVIEDIEYIQEKQEPLDSTLINTILLIKSKEKKNLFLEELKSKLTDTELCILDSRKYRFGKRVGLDVSDYANDLRGIPEIVDGRSAFLGNIDLPRAGSCKEKGILIFDEVSNADESTHGIIDCLLDTRKLMSYELPKGWSIIVILDSLDFRWVRKIISRASAFRIE